MTSFEAQWRQPPAPATVEYGGAREYADELRKWMLATQCLGVCHHLATWQAFAHITGQALGQAPLVAPQAQAPQASSVPVNVRANRQFIERRALSSFPRRIVAETIDSVFAFAIKLFIIYVLVEIGFVDLDKYDRLLGNEADLQTLIDVTQELFPVEMLAKIVVSVAEAYFISYGLGAVPAGCTPGKALMGIQVISCQEVTPVAASDAVNIQRTTNIPFKNSLLRSLMKNMLINLLFPLSAAAYAFSFNRALYDLTAKTIVVHM